MPNFARICENLAEVRARIADAARRSERRADEVQLVAVTKFVGEGEIRTLVEAGCRALGESRPQHLWEKAAALDGLPIQWHMIGHLQRNKIRRTLPQISLLQSADSPRLIEAVNEAAAELKQRVPILLEVNVSGDEAKHGFEPDAIEPHLERLAELQHVEVRGLMCMASLEGGPSVARRNFASLRELAGWLKTVSPPSLRFDELSMGMSGDYEIAIEEGATIVRVGSALFEGVE